MMRFDSKGTKVLVADSDRTVLEMMQIRLEVAGYHVLPARGGREAIETLHIVRPAAVILERNLPDVDGMQVIRELYAQSGGRPPPILLIGRNLNAEEVRYALTLGVRDVLAKPFSGAVLLERLSRMVQRSASAPQPPPQRLTAVNL
jgi:DNA-binding response OmpR family regulator